MKILIKTKVKGLPKEILSKFNDELFLKLKPPFVDLKLNRFDGCQKGDEVHLSIYPPLIGEQKWISLITSNISKDDYCDFIDEGIVLPKPLTYWHHHHKIVKLNKNYSYIIDEINFKSSNKLLDYLLYVPLWLQFFYRKPIYKKVFN